MSDILPTQNMIDFLQQISSNLSDADATAMANALIIYLPKYGITTHDQLLVFMAQIAYESNHFTAIEENLNYSSTGLLKTFPTHFTAKDAVNYAHNSEKIANRAYANRYGNGDEASGDGWKYRGRGYIQITFKDNYLDFAKATGRDFTTITDYVATIGGAVESACWFWNMHKLQRYDDRDSMNVVTKIVQGSIVSLPQRLALYDDIALINL